MIGYLKGTIIEKTLKEVWVNVRDVGYVVRIGEEDSAVWRVGDEVEVWIHTHVREEAFDLYGFSQRSQVNLFKMVIGVSGIGPKIGMAIAGSRTVAQIEKAVQDGDVAFFQSVPGLGKKGAQKVIVELKGKMGSLSDLDLSGDGGDGEVVEALQQFGFARAEVLAVVSNLDTSLSVEQQVREGLRRLGKRT